jgi:hypothetical protein
VRVEIVHVGGRYSERVFAHLSEVSPSAVDAYQVPRSLPPVLDDAGEYLPSELGAGDVIVAINVHPEILLEIPTMVAGGSTRALIAPIEDPNWIRPGLQRQVTQACAGNDMESAFPKPFCSLEPATPAVAEFCEQLRVGKPTFKMTLDGGKVAAVEVVRGSPCGVTDFVAQELVGLPADDSLHEKAGQLHHTYPCLASMSLDPSTGETIMHASLYLMWDGVKAALQEARKGED